ncbi:GHMP kinase [Hafnia alvei]|uniref:GHMP family kinase ATP-binding protein n=1 Tax=Hafnia alvei TaxID=569 RepID=UPI001413495F|nr:GHMP kinase [Hafnia alvei]QIP55585.1 GHMP kinase [Hafnia alvei]
MAEASCPASCGELLQGWMNGGEKLISCPINWYSTVYVNEGEPSPQERPRMRQMLQQVLSYFGESPRLAESMRIEFDSTIPVAKGLASSTADIAATAVATARLLNRSLSAEQLAILCVGIEPTDSTIFKNLTLFDHQTAQTQQHFPWLPTLDIVLLESPQRIITEEFHRRDRQSLLLNQAQNLENALIQFHLANHRRCYYRLGEATTLSAIASEALLPKPEFNQLRDLVEHWGIYGLNVAHSGSVVGLLCDRRKHDIDKIVSALQERKITHSYPRIHVVKTVVGGVH